MLGLLILLALVVGVVLWQKKAAKAKAEAEASARANEQQRQRRVEETAATMRSMMMTPSQIAQAARAEMAAEEQVRQENRQQYMDSLKNRNRP